MSRYTMIILTEPKEGREDEFHEWYDHHLDRMLELDDCVSAQLFEWAHTSDKYPPPPQRNIALYEFETDDVAETARRMSDRMGTDEMPDSDAKAITLGWFYKPVTERRTKP